MDPVSGPGGRRSMGSTVHSRAMTAHAVRRRTTHRGARGWGPLPMGRPGRCRDGSGMHPRSNPSPRFHSSSYALGAPALLLVSVAPLVLMVVVIALVGVTNAGWAVAAA